MTVKLNDLQDGTEFSIEGQKFKKGGGYVKGNETQCQPFLGGKFQTSQSLMKWFDNSTEVEVRS